MSEARKFLVAAVTAAASASALGLLPDPWNGWAAVVCATAGVFGVYAVPNAPPSGG